MSGPGIRVHCLAPWRVCHEAYWMTLEPVTLPHGGCWKDKREGRYLLSHPEQVSKAPTWIASSPHHPAEGWEKRMHPASSYGRSYGGAPSLCHSAERWGKGVCPAQQLWRHAVWLPWLQGPLHGHHKVPGGVMLQGNHTGLTVTQFYFLGTSIANLNNQELKIQHIM